MTDFPGLDLAALHKYLQAAGVEVSGELRAELISGGKSNLTYGIFDDNSKWILRRPPTVGLTPSAHDVAREFRITSALQNTAVPVAPTVVLCEDASVMGASFTVVEFVTGQVIEPKPSWKLFRQRRSRSAPTSWCVFSLHCTTSTTPQWVSANSADPTVT